MNMNINMNYQLIYLFIKSIQRGMILSIYIPIHLYIYLPTYLPSYLPIYLSTWYCCEATVSTALMTCLSTWGVEAPLESAVEFVPASLKVYLYFKHNFVLYEFLCFCKEQKNSSKPKKMRECMNIE